ncbi:HlyD family efflux transporter periplasmic adaptor subunit [Labilibacter sediminis]|nr:HlyD family efflux transporter periplasmic adaptor subunit [Labilibacter sediminis]
MKDKIFPIEILNSTTENHYIKNSKPFKYIYLTILLLIFSFLISLPLVDVSITSQSRGIIKTQKESTPIQTATYGLVEYCFIEEGKNVSKGDTLLILNTDNIREQINQISKTISDNKLFIKDLNCLLFQNKSISSAKYLQIFSEYQSKLKEFDIQLQLLRKEYEIAEYLFKEKVTAEIEYLKKKNSYESLLAEKELFKKQYQNQWQSEKTKLELENEKLRLTIRQHTKEKKQYLITSPTNGTIIDAKGISTGSFLSPGQTIAYISPDEELIAECYISPSDIGYIKLYQHVNFQVDAYNYNNWGFIEGKVIHISEDIITINDNPTFKVQCQLLQKQLKLNSGYAGNIKKGMTLTGRFYLNKRSLFQLLYDKADDWMNPKNNLLSNLNN